MDIYDIQTNIWLNNLPSLSISHRRFCCQVANDYLFAIGGINGGAATIDRIEKIYLKNMSNIQNEQWQTLSERLTQTKRSFRCATIGDLIYIVGGWNANVGAANIPRVDRINTLDDSVNWDSSLSSGLVGVGLVATSDRILHSIGGANLGFANRVTRRWQYSSKLPSLSPTPSPTTSPTTITKYPTNE
eukprot:398689_1